VRCSRIEMRLSLFRTLENYSICAMLVNGGSTVFCVQDFRMQSAAEGNSGPPSLTALTAAAARAAHLLVDSDPRIFADTLAAALLGDRAEELIAYRRAHGKHVVLAGARAQVTCRSRYTEDHLADSAPTRRAPVRDPGNRRDALRPVGLSVLVRASVSGRKPLSGRLMSRNRPLSARGRSPAEHELPASDGRPAAARTARDRPPPAAHRKAQVRQPRGGPPWPG
jgi:hypothetical protein